MKTIIIVVILSASFLFGQTIADSTQLKRNYQKSELIKNHNSEMKMIQNQIGSKENQENSIKENRKKKDVFIDKDGDGICDTRQGGMSFNKMRKRMGAGKQGPESKKGGGNHNGSSFNGGR